MNLKKLRNRGLKIELDSVIERPPGHYSSGPECDKHFLVTLKVYNTSIFPILHMISYTLGEYEGGCLYPSPSKPEPIYLPGKLPFLRGSELEWYPLEVVVYGSMDTHISLHLLRGFYPIAIERKYKYSLSPTTSQIVEHGEYKNMALLEVPSKIEDIEKSFRSAF